jgi:hypothetical protein
MERITHLTASIIFASEYRRLVICWLPSKTVLVRKVVGVVLEEKNVHLEY